MNWMRTWRGAGVLRALIVVAFVLRAWVPAGYMLSAAGEGAALVLCSAQGPIAVTIDPVTGKVSIAKKTPAKSTERDDTPCAFAGLAKIGARSLSIEPMQPMALSAQPVLHFASFLPGRGLNAPPPPATGPPSQIA